MPRKIDLIRASKLPSNMMQFAAKGALQVAPGENIEILVYLAKHSKIFGETARLTLAGWDEKASLAAAADPNTSAEVHVPTQEEEKVQESGQGLRRVKDIRIAYIEKRRIVLELGAGTYHFKIRR